MIQIDKHIPIPDLTAKYPFKAMEVGDSFLAPPDRSKSARVAAQAHARRYNMKFATRTIDGATRVWRIA